MYCGILICIESSKRLYLKLRLTDSSFYVIYHIVMQFRLVWKEVTDVGF